MSNVVETSPPASALNVNDILFEELKATRGATFQVSQGMSSDEKTSLFYTFLHQQLKADDERRNAVPSDAESSEDYAKNRNERAALCLSGGGIRSATFNLGILQELARLGLLQKFEYLSTVSGGGYIGSWLKTWMHREGVGPVVEQLYTLKKTPLSPEPEPIEFLRDYSNYLSPKLGLFSADTWTLVALYLRNLLLNWLVMIPLAAAFLALPRVIESLDLWVNGSSTNSSPSGTTLILLAAASVAAIAAVVYRNRYQPSSRSEKNDEGNTGGRFLRFFLTPLMLAACCFALAWASWGSKDRSSWIRPAYWWIPVAGCILLNLLGWISNWQQLWCSKRTTLNSVAGVLISGTVAGLCIWLIVYEFFPDPSVHPVLYASLGAPLFLGSFLMGSVIWAGFTSRSATNADLEWWARDGAWVLIAIVVWIATSLLALAGPALFLYVTNVWGRGILTAILPASGGATALLGKSSSTPANHDEARKLPTSAIYQQYGLMAAALLFVVAFAIALSYLTDTLLNLIFQVGVRFPTEWCQHDQMLQNTQVWQALLIASGLLAAGVMAGFFVDVNKFSLHQSYRNRLVRAYLGASNLRRKCQADKFTGFDEKDNLAVHELIKSDGPPNRPFHVVNIALNLVATDKLSWQQRKAESFTVSALHAGCHNLGYRRSSQYRGGLDHGKVLSGGAALNDAISVGTAMAISGAAASPNEGYQSSPLIGLIMTFFNVRLGAWLDNPVIQSMPARALASNSAVPIIQEALGLTNNTSSRVYLSDGGHFENLGIYEMVLRRCRYIVVGDAGCDPECTFEDLGNAIRKIRIDLGVSIDLSTTNILPRSRQKPGAYCAVGTIDYSTVDGKDAVPGTLIYLKPAFYGSEPTDVYNYGQNSKSFPHETTLDQFFTESQFESYRSLGAYLLRRVSQPKEGNAKPRDFKEFSSTVTENSRTPSSNQAD